MYQRTVTEWERQRNRLEMEHGELMSRVDYLSDEVRLAIPFTSQSMLSRFSDRNGEAARHCSALSSACCPSVRRLDAWFQRGSCDKPWPRYHEIQQVNERVE